MNPDSEPPSPNTQLRDNPFSSMANAQDHFRQSLARTDYYESPGLEDTQLSWHHPGVQPGPRSARGSL